MIWKKKKKIIEKEAKVEKLKRMDKYYEGELEGAEKNESRKRYFIRKSKKSR